MVVLYCPRTFCVDQGKPRKTSKRLKVLRYKAKTLDMVFVQGGGRKIDSNGSFELIFSSVRLEFAKN